jgi:hypothetical protein
MGILDTSSKLLFITLMWIWLFLCTFQVSYTAICPMKLVFNSFPWECQWTRPPLWSSGQSSWLHNGDVLCFQWGTNWIYVCYVEESRPLLWASSQSSWLHIQRSGFDSRRYQIFWEVVGLERGPLSLVSTIEELLRRKSSGSCLQIWEYNRWDSSRWSRGTLYQQTLALTSLKSGGRSVGIVHSRTQATEFSLVLVCCQWAAY